MLLWLFDEMMLGNVDDNGNDKDYGADNEGNNDDDVNLMMIAMMIWLW
jgi:hypothetical protein